MDLDSCMYACDVWHHRFTPKVHSFSYKIYLFYLDLDELDRISKNRILFSRNRLNLYNFRDKDHLQLKEKGSVKTNIIEYLNLNGISANDIGKIFLLTNVVTAGYIFNPVSFYYVFDQSNQPLCTIVEVCNTFGELKPYFIGKSEWNGTFFEKKTTKYFYVSPFIEHDAIFHFQHSIPNDFLNIHIDDINANNETIIKTGINGKKVVLNDLNMVFYFVTIPLVTVKIIVSIYWQALLLWIKKINYHKKNDNLTLQRDVFRKHKSLINYADDLTENAFKK